MLYLLKVAIEVPCDPRYGRGTNIVPPKTPFWTNELVVLDSPRWKVGSGESLLAVVQSCAVAQNKTQLPHHEMTLSLLVCVSSTGGDGVGGRGGWLPLKHIQQCVGNGKSTGIPVTISSAATITTGCREFQALMSLSELPESIRRCLLSPKVGNDISKPRQISSSFSTDSRAVSFRRGRGRDHNNGAGGKRGERTCGNGSGPEEAQPPPNVPTGLWNVVLQTFNRSQVQAIRRIADGSPSGFTLLQVRAIRLNALNAQLVGSTSASHV